MWTSRWSRAGSAAALLGALALLNACDRGDVSSTRAAPATRPAPQAVATRPPARPPALITIDGQPARFPAAKLVVTHNATGLDAVLCSDDPPAAIEPGYLGNSFMFEMRLDVDNTADLPSAVWEWKAPRKSVQDNADGIFLAGGRHEMQPADVRVTFTRPDPNGPVIANMNGTFYAFDPHDLAAPLRSVNVAGAIAAVVQEQ